MKGNETALGFDLKTGPTLGELERARASRQPVLTHQIPLVQDPHGRSGVVLIWPVFAAPSGPAPVPAEAAPFLGFVQGVFHPEDLIAAAVGVAPDTVLDMLFVDSAETDPARRILYRGPARLGEPLPKLPEDAFRNEAVAAYRLDLGGRQWEVLYRPRDGWVEAQFTMTPGLRACGVLVVTSLLAGLVYSRFRRTELVEREVTDRTAELTESRRQLSSLMHALPGMAVRCRYDGELVVVYVSEGALALTGWDAAELISGVTRLRESVHPDDRARVEEATWTALEKRTDLEVEFRIRTKTGAEKWVLLRGRGVYRETGEIELFEGLAIDISAQKRAEHERISLERKLLEGQKLESLGLLAGGIAHDFNNLLTGVLGNASLARLSLPPGGPTEPLLRAIEVASLRAAELCRQMLAYAGKGRFQVEPVDLTLLTEGLLPLLQVSIAHHATLRLSLARDLPAVMGDATQLRQIVMNLVLNAADAIGASGGDITITTGVIYADAGVLARCAAGAELTVGNYVFLEVRDTGCGMTPDVIAKIFDPFFTTKFAGRGLGLAAVLGIVRGHEGALNVESTPGVGSAFRLLLPPTGLPAPSAGATPASDSVWRCSGHALVIDDEEPVRLVAAHMLKSVGLTSVIAPDGHAGLGLFRRNPASFDVVLLDLMMPGIDGEETLEALRATHPSVRVLLMSGYNEGDLLRRLANDSSPLAFLSKPFTREALIEKLRLLLG